MRSLTPKRAPADSPPEILGLDIGGTKCAVSILADGRVTELDRFATEDFEPSFARMCAGRGTRTMIFLTSGTGMGSGLILDGRLFEGTTGDAGEIGHVRLRATGPVGYNKAGSVEGFTSGGGIARLAESLLASAPTPPPWLRPGTPLTLQTLAAAARAGDAFAQQVLRLAGEYLGETLALLIDLFNPERIVLGGFFPRCRDLLEPHLYPVLEREALPVPRAACAIVPAALGETIGSHGAIAAALHALELDPS